MVDYREDPCKEEEQNERPDPYAPEIPPATPRALELPTAAFPVRTSAPIDRETIRSSALIEKFSLNEGHSPGSLRLPSQAYLVSEWQDNLDLVDSFRYVGAFNYQFQGNTNLAFINRTLSVNEKAGSFFEVKLDSSMLGAKEKNKVMLNFDVPTVQNFLNKYRIDVDYSKFLFALINGTPGFGAGGVPLIADTFTYKYDSSFKAPAAFFKSEAEQSSVPLVEVASLQPVVGDLPLQESNRPEIQEPSLYRVYANTLNEDHPIKVQQDIVQKFDAKAVFKLDEIAKSSTNQLVATPGFSGLDRTVATDQLLVSPLFAKAEMALNTHMRLSLNSNHESKFCRIIQDSFLDSIFMDFLASPQAQQLDTNFVQVLDQSTLGGVANNRMVFDYEPIVYDGEAFMETVFENISSTVNYMDATKSQHPIPYYENSVDEARSRIEEAFFTGIPEGELNNFISENRRSYKEVLEGKMSFSEVVAFRVEKRLIETDEVIQNFFFFNDQESNSIEFLDSQVSYNKGYHYKIYAINAVLGNRFYYNTSNEDYDLAAFTGPKPFYDFNVDNEVVFNFIETPYFEQQLFMIDKPPVFPQCEVVPFFQDSTKVGFRVTPTFGSFKEVPIQILDSDEQLISKMKMSQGSMDEKVHFSGDSQPTQYQILFMEQKPFSYSDFSKATVATVDATYNSGYVELNLQANKFYYMVFRALDAAGVSNPSLIYTIKLNAHADGVFVEFDEFDLEPQTLEEPMTFSKILKIEPSPNQATVNFSNYEFTSDFYSSAPPVTELELGVLENKVWSKDYKFRLVSKSSNRSIDINVNYGYKIIKPSTPLDLDSLRATIEPDNPYATLALGTAQGADEELVALIEEDLQAVRVDEDIFGTVQEGQTFEAPDDLVKANRNRRGRHSGNREEKKSEEQKEETGKRDSRANQRKDLGGNKSDFSTEGQKTEERAQSRAQRRRERQSNRQRNRGTGYWGSFSY